MTYLTNPSNLPVHVILLPGWQPMETILKTHNLIELPRGICCKLDLMHGTRLEVELDEKTGKIILTPVHRHGTHLRPDPGKRYFTPTHEPH